MKSSASNDFAQFSRGRNQHVFQYCEYHLLNGKFTCYKIMLNGNHIAEGNTEYFLVYCIDRKPGKTRGDQYEGRALFFLSFYG